MTPRLRVAFAVLACAAAAPSFAQVSADCKKPRRDPGMMSESLYHQLESATELVAKNKNAEAIEKFQKMAEHGGDYEKAVVYYNMGFAYNAMNRLPDALKTFEKALAFHSLPIQQEEQLTFNVGQLYVANGQFDEGIRVLQNYIATACATVVPEAHIFLGNAYAEKKRFADALKEVEIAVNSAKEPKESWLQLKLALHYELKQLPKCAETLLQLLAIAPAKPDYWKQLSGILFDLKQDKDSLAVLALAGNQGFLKTGSEYKNLASIYLLLEIPYKAGTLLQEAIDKKLLPADEKNLDLLSGAWMNARDNARAEAALKKLAAVADKGDYYMRLGYVYIESERWKEAVATLEKAASKGVKKPGDTALLLAKAAYEAGDKKKSIQAAQNALKYDESRKAANEWLGYLRQEQVAEESIAAANAAREEKAQEKKEAAAQKEAERNPPPEAPAAPQPPAAPAPPPPKK